MILSPILFVMERAAREAGDALKHDFANRENLLIDSKTPGDFVSEADHRSENIVVDILRSAHPDWGILGEEGTDVAASDDGYRWIVDPLDGTSYFLHGVPHWSVTIALEKHGAIIAGLTFNPMLDEIFYAEKGQGAFLNGKKIHVADKTSFKQAMVAVNIGYCRGEAQALVEMGSVSEKIYLEQGCALSGVGLALEMAYVAAGRFDLVHCWSAQPWDLAAGLLLVEEAGGKVTNANLLPLQVEKSSVLAGNAVLHSAYTKLME